MVEKAIVVLGTRAEGELEMIQSRGFKVVLLSQHVDPEVAWRVDVPVECDLNDEVNILNILAPLRERFDIRGVFTLNDYRVPLAAKLSENLCLNNFMSYAAALNCRNKFKARFALKQSGLGDVGYARAQSEKELVAFLKDFTFPVVIKPINDSGSRLVRVCGCLDEAIEAYRAVAAESNNWVGQVKDDGVLIEEYVSGDEYSVESASANGITRIIGVTQKCLSDPPAAFETGHNFPAQLSKNEFDKVKILVCKVHEALGIRWGVTHTEIRSSVNGFRVIEVNGRAGGGKIQQLVLAVTGYDLYEIALHILINRDVNFEPVQLPVTESASIRFVYAQENMIVNSNNFQQILNIPNLVKFYLSVEDGAAVGVTQNNYERLGYYITHNSA